eukprot:jgi/Botrbrau1/20451/Bobra.145_2s0015.1
MNTSLALIVQANILAVASLRRPYLPRLARADHQLCTCVQWFARPTEAQRFRLFYLSLNLPKVRVFLRFRLGVPIDMGRRQRLTRRERLRDMCGSAVGDKHHFPALTPVYVRYPQLQTIVCWSR